MEDHFQIWQEAVSRLREKYPDAYRVLLSKCALVRVDPSTKKGQPDTWVIGAPTRFLWDFFANSYQKLLRETITSLSGVQVRFAVEETGDVQETADKPPVVEVPKPVVRSLHPDLRKNYTFDRFVVGKSNEFAHNAAAEIARTSSSRYNPLYIRGGTGLGKTHLMHAMGHYLYQNRGERGVTYVTSEEFLNDFVSASRNQRMAEFRKHYRDSSDVLLVDDIQFLAGNKEHTQEEFFHTFNSLHDSGKQIVLTSDRSPRELNGIEDRLRTRFEWGLIVEIKPPDFDERLRILQRKATEGSMLVPSEVLESIAKIFKSNIRELEGALNKLSAMHDLTRSPIDMDMVGLLFGEQKNEHQASITSDEIMKSVAAFFGVRQQDLKSDRRHRQIAVPRQVAMFLCRKLLKMSFPEIGSTFGGRDHTTVMHSVGKVERVMGEDPEFRVAVETLENRLQNSGP